MEQVAVRSLEEILKQIPTDPQDRVYYRGEPKEV